MKFKEAYVILVPEVNSRPFMTVDPKGQKYSRYFKIYLLYNSCTESSSSS